MSEQVRVQVLYLSFARLTVVQVTQVVDPQVQRGNSEIL